MIESEYFQSENDCRDFLTNHAINESDIEYLMKYAKFFSEGNTAYCVKIYNPIKTARLVIVSESNLNYTLVLNKDEMNYMYSIDGILQFEKLEYESIGVYTNTILGIIPTEYDDLEVFSLNVQKRSWLN